MQQPDKLFLDPGRRSGDFVFDAAVAAVFDDMLQRSIPFYLELQHMLLDCCQRYAKDQQHIYDLGCSTGMTMQLLLQHFEQRPIKIIGVDNSEPMLLKTEQRLLGLANRNWQLQQHDLNQGFTADNASVIILNLVLQFIQPDQRANLLKQLYFSLNDTGCLLLVEKVNCAHEELDKLFTDLYHAFKQRNLYTEQEIAHKRTALENVLQPYTLAQNQALLQMAGFTHIELFFRWFNFCGFIALK